MFQEPSEYNSANQISMRSVREVLEDYNKHITYGDNDLILDVGCGSGNVTHKVLLPFIPNSDFRLVGVDKLKDMIEFSTAHIKVPGLDFRVLNITENDERCLKSVFTEQELTLGFSKVFSFHCLQYTLDYPRSYANIFSLMRPGGQLFTLNIAYCSVCNIWDSVYNMEEWKPYLKDVPIFSFPYHDRTPSDTVRECTYMLKNIGFEDIICYCEPKFLLPEGLPHPPVRSLMKQVDPYLRAIPSELHAKYMDDVMEKFAVGLERTPGLPYNSLIVIASKPQT